MCNSLRKEMVIHYDENIEIQNDHFRFSFVFIVT